MKFPTAFALALMLSPATAEVVLKLPTNARLVTLTLDACEQNHPMRLDTTITDYLVARRIPFTVFLSGMLVRDNADAVKKLSALPFVEFENHSWDHP